MLGKSKEEKVEDRQTQQFTTVAIKADSKRKEEKKPDPISLADLTDVLTKGKETDKYELSKTVVLGSPVFEKIIPPREVAPIQSEYSFDSPEDKKSEEINKEVELLFKQKQDKEAAEEKEKAIREKLSQEAAKIAKKIAEPEDQYDSDFD